MHQVNILYKNKHLSVQACPYPPLNLSKNSRSASPSTAINKDSVRLDDRDLRIIALLVSGKDNKQIAQEEKMPLSTIQRRTRSCMK